MTLISVKSQYGSCSGNCTGIIKINYTPLTNSITNIILLYIYIHIYIYNKKNTRKVPFAGMTGWAVNSIAKAIRGSIPFLPSI